MSSTTLKWTKIYQSLSKKLYHNPIIFTKWPVDTGIGIGVQGVTLLPVKSFLKKIRIWVTPGFKFQFFSVGFPFYRVGSSGPGFVDFLLKNFLLKNSLPRFIKKPKYRKWFLAWKITKTMMDAQMRQKRRRTPQQQRQSSPKEKRENSSKRCPHTTYCCNSSKNWFFPIFLNKTPIGTIGRDIETKARSSSSILRWRSWVLREIEDSTSNKGVRWLDARGESFNDRLG